MYLFTNFRVVCHKIAKISNFYEDVVPQMKPRFFRHYFRIYKEGLQSLTDFLSTSIILKNVQEKSTISMAKIVAMTTVYLGSKSTTIT